MKQKQKQKGFTLVEAMIVVAILAVLASIAVPSYMEQIKKSRRADAKVTLSTLAQYQENYYADYPSYASVLGAATDATTGTLGCKNACVLDTGVAYSSDRHYKITVNRTTSSSYTLTAEAAVAGTGGTGGTGAQISDAKCKFFVLNAANQKAAGATAAVVDNLGTANADPARCWK